MSCCGAMSGPEGDFSQQARSSNGVYNGTVVLNNNSTLLSGGHVSEELASLNDAS
jgi:hypothetical protein